MFRLDGKIALVTGGGRGIGRACSEALAEQGAHVIVNYVNDETAAKSTTESIRKNGGIADIVPFNVADFEATEQAIDALLKQYGKIDILIANAGVAIDGLLLRMNEDDLDRMFRVNLKGALACAKGATRSMMKHRSGRILFLSSVVGEMGNVGQTAYAATKAALIGAAKSIAREYASRHITVNIIAPGFIETDMTAHLDEATRQHHTKQIPLGRIGGGRDVAAAAVYLASDEASYITGQVLRVNGGMYI